MRESKLDFLLDVFLWLKGNWKWDESLSQYVSRCQYPQQSCGVLPSVRGPFLENKGWEPSVTRPGIMMVQILNFLTLNFHFINKNMNFTSSSEITQLRLSGVSRLEGSVQYLLHETQQVSSSKDCALHLSLPFLSPDILLSPRVLSKSIGCYCTPTTM